MRLTDIRKMGYASLRSSGSERRVRQKGSTSGTLDIRQCRHRAVCGRKRRANTEIWTDILYETAAYVDALESTDYLLFVGRKGTGKTANLIMLAKTIGDEIDTHVCGRIRPTKYEIDSILRLFDLSRNRADHRLLVAFDLENPFIYKSKVSIHLSTPLSV